MANIDSVVRFRFSKKEQQYLDEEEFDDVIERRREEADEFYYRISPMPMTDDLRNIQRQAFSGMMWTKQHYHFVWDQWAKGDPKMPPPPPDRMGVRNSQWKHSMCPPIMTVGNVSKTNTANSALRRHSFNARLMGVSLLRSLG
jgi:hypothetical protein